jgi:hypothetical protein
MAQDRAGSEGLRVPARSRPLVPLARRMYELVADAVAGPGEEERRAVGHDGEHESVREHRVPSLRRKAVLTRLLVRLIAFPNPVAASGAAPYFGSSPVTWLIAPEIPPDKSVKAAIAPTVMTARTTPYSAIV